MTLNLLFFAHYQDVVGAPSRSVALPEPATVRDLARRLQSDFPSLGDLLAHGRVAVNAEFADGDSVLSEGDEVAWMPPMSGGNR